MKSIVISTLLIVLSFTPFFAQHTPPPPGGGPPGFPLGEIIYLGLAALGLGVFKYSKSSKRNL